MSPILGLGENAGMSPFGIYAGLPRISGIQQPIAVLQCRCRGTGNVELHIAEKRERMNRRCKGRARREREGHRLRGRQRRYGCWMSASSDPLDRKARRGCCDFRVR
jgi:hypothetical protein